MKKTLSIAKVILVIAIIAVPSWIIAQSFDTHTYSVNEPGAMKLSKNCKTCHKVIYNEWIESMHANSSFTKDKLHNAMKIAFEHSVPEGETAGYFCAHCHTPMIDNMMEVIGGKVIADANDPKIQEGIGCHFCHSIESVHDGMPSKYYQLSADGSVQGPGRSTMKTPIHDMKVNPLFETAEICSGCHGYLKNDKGVSICSLKEEEWDGVTNCQDCHMQDVDGKPSSMSKRTTHKSHKMAGGHSPDMLNNAGSVMISSSRSDDAINIVVSVTNQTAHKLPSTMPLRMAVLKVTAKDKTGDIVWENFTQNPMAEDKEAVFIKVFGAGDKMGVPTWEADKIVMDTRIPAWSTITRNYEIPIDGVHSVDAALLYFVIPPDAIKMFHLEPDGYLEVPHVISMASVDV